MKSEGPAQNYSEREWRSTYLSTAVFRINEIYLLFRGQSGIRLFVFMNVHFQLKMLIVNRQRQKLSKISFDNILRST